MKKFFNLFKKRLTNLQIAILFLIIAVIIFFPYASGRFHADDFIFVSILEEKIPYNPLTGFWAIDFQDVKTFDALWWKDSEVNGRFLRPIPSLVFAGFFSIFGRDAAVPLHIFSIILHALVSFTVFLLLFKFSKRYAVSFLAAFIFLISEDHSMTIGWIATNTDLMAVLFMNLAIYFHIRYRESSQIKNFITSNVLLFFAFFCKETAVITPIAIILYEFILIDSPIKEKNLWKRFYNKLILFIKSKKYWVYSFWILVLFLLFYKLAGFGTNNIMYYDPFRRTGMFLSNVLIGLPVMFVGLLSIFPIGLTLFIPDLLIPTIILGVVLYLILSITLAPYWQEKVIHYCFLLLIISLLPQLSTDASERQLYFPFVVGSYLISHLILQIKFLKKRFLPDLPKGVKYLGSVFGYYLAISSVVLALVISLSYPYMYKPSLESAEKLTLKSLPILENRNYENLIFLNTDGPFSTFYQNDIVRYHLGKYKNVYVLSSFNGKVWMKQISDSSIILRTDQKGWLSNMFAKIIRIYPKIEMGKEYPNKLFTAEILQTTLDNVDALQVRFDFNLPLKNSETIFLYYDGTNVKEWKFNSTKKEAWQMLGDTSDIMKSMM